MCTETQLFYACGCVTILHDICAAHIAHTHRQVDNNPCADFQQKQIMGCRRCCRICEERKDEFYNFETRGESLFQRHKRITEEWEAERKEREAEQLKNEAAGAAYGKDDGEKQKSRAQLLLKNHAESDGRGGKRVKREQSADMEIEEYEGEDESDKVQIEDETVDETDSDGGNAIRDLLRGSSVGLF